MRFLPKFKESLNVLLQISESYFNKTYKWAVERLRILKAPRLYFGATLVYFGILLGQFWFLSVICGRFGFDLELLSPTFCIN